MRKLSHNIMFEYKQDESLTIKYLQIEPTNICNSNCMFCIRKLKNQKPKNMTVEELKVITCNFKHIKFIKLQGLGECFFNPDLSLLLAHLKRCYPGVVIMSSTNLNCPRTDQELSDILENLDILYFSVDGGTRDTYEKIREGCSWNIMHNTLNQLSRLKKPQNNYVLSFTASNLNYREIEKVIKLAQKFPIDEVRINPVQDWTSDNRLTISNNYSGKEYIRELRRWHELKLVGNMDVIVVGDPEFDYNRCIWPFERMHLDVYGNVFVCVISLDDIWCPGNIFKGHPDTIFRNKTMNAIRSCIRVNIAHEHCKTCSYKLLASTLRAIKGKK